MAGPNQSGRENSDARDKSRNLGWFDTRSRQEILPGRLGEIYQRSIYVSRPEGRELSRSQWWVASWRRWKAAHVNHRSSSSAGAHPYWTRTRERRLADHWTRVRDSMFTCISDWPSSIRNPCNWNCSRRFARDCTSVLWCSQQDIPLLGWTWAQKCRRAWTARGPRPKQFLRELCGRYEGEEDSCHRWDVWVCAASTPLSGRFNRALLRKKL